MVKISLIVGWLFCLLSVPILAQAEKDKWQRVYTGEESGTDINGSSATFDAGHVMRVRFRTTLSKPESLKAKPGTKYKSRLETIEFNLRDKQYRYHDISLLDSNGKTVESYEANASDDWKVMKDGGMMQRLFDAARQMTPFGNWKVVDYRFGDGTRDDAKKLVRLLGTFVSLSSDRAEVDAKVCNSPAYQSRQVTDNEFIRRLRISLASLGINADPAETIEVKCEAKDWAPPQSVIVKLPEDRMLLLWEGVFLVLKKER